METSSERVALSVEPDEAVDATALELSEPDPGGAPLTIVLAGSNEPLPGAVVTWLARADSIHSGSIHPLRKRLEIAHKLLDESGTHMRADGEGRVTLGGASSHRFVRARGVLDGVHYMGLHELSGGERVFEVRPERGFEVEVVDLDGRPVEGAEVELWIEQEGRAAWGHGVARTAASGWVFLPVHVDDGEGARAFGKGWIRLLGLFAEHVEVPVDWRGGTPARVHLVQPDVGVVRVTVVDAFGNSLADGTVEVVRDREDSYEKRTASMVSGRATEVGPIEVGLGLRVSYFGDAPGSRVSRSGLVIPSAREGLDVELRAKSKEPWLAGRLVSASGQPLAGESLTVAALKGGPNDWVAGSNTIRTGPDGRFQLAAPWIKRSRTELSMRTERIGT